MKKKCNNCFRLSRSFWSQFHAKHTSLRVECQGHVSINRALNCTREIACNHLNDLAEELQAAGFMKNAEKIEDGEWKYDISTSRLVSIGEFVFIKNILNVNDLISNY